MLSTLYRIQKDKGLGRLIYTPLRMLGRHTVTEDRRVSTCFN